MDRLGNAQEVADVIVFLASRGPYWLNGRNIPVDGLEQPHAALDRRPYQAWARASSRPARTRRQMNASSMPLL
jgi:hypothetical protein